MSRTFESRLGHLYFPMINTSHKSSINGLNKKSKRENIQLPGPPVSCIWCSYVRAMRYMVRLTKSRDNKLITVSNEANSDYSINIDTSPKRILRLYV